MATRWNSFAKIGAKASRCAKMCKDFQTPNASRSESVTCSSNWFVNTMAPSSLRKSRQLGEGCDVTGSSGETTQLRLGCQEGDTFDLGLTSARLY